MIHELYRFEGFDAKDFEALVALVRPTRARGQAEIGKRSGLLVVVVDEDDAVVGAVHTRRGRIAGIRSTKDPEALAHVHRAARVVVLREGALEDLGERIALRIRPEQDYLEQLFTVLESLRELERAGALRTFPGTLASVVLPSAETMRRALGLLAGDGELFVLCIHGTHGLDAAYAFRRRDGAFDAVYGPRTLLAATGPLPGRFEDDHDAVVAAVDRELGPVHLGVSLRAGVAHKILTQRAPGALSSAFAARDLLARPAPPLLAVGVGLDTLASALSGLRDAFVGSPLGDVFTALLSVLDGRGGVPGRTAVESWLELLAAGRSRR